MEFLSIPATNSALSINRRVLNYAETLISEQVPDSSISSIDLNDYEMAIFSPEREAEGIPDEARQLIAKIGAADAIVMSFAEHNGSYTAAWKNTLDWMSRVDMKPFQEKPVVLFSASPGGRGGASVLGAAVAGMPFLGAEVISHLSIGNFFDTFDSDADRLIDGDLDAQFTSALGELIERVQGAAS